MIPSSIRMYVMIGVLALSAIVPSCTVYNKMSAKVDAVTIQCKLDKDVIVQTYKEKLLNAKIESLEEHNKLLSDHRKITDAKNAEIKRISTNLDTALNSLRDRPSRPSPSASSPGVPSTGDCEAGTGAGLSREDAEFLTREAARANEIRAALDDAYKKYDSLKDKVNNLFQSQAP